MSCAFETMIHPENSHVEDKSFEYPSCPCRSSIIPLVLRSKNRAEDIDVFRFGLESKNAHAHAPLAPFEARTFLLVYERSALEPAASEHRQILLSGNHGLFFQSSRSNLT